MEQIAGKKKSKFWVYAVEPVQEANLLPLDPLDTGASSSDVDGQPNGHIATGNDTSPSQSPGINGQSNASNRSASPMQS